MDLSSSIWDAIVVGCGPAGSSAARALSDNGHSVLILESKDEVGVPVQCGEAVSMNTLEVSGLGTDGPWMVANFDGYRIVSPSGKSLFSRTEGANIRRDLFDRELSERATSAGAELRTGSPVSEVRRKDDLWKVRCLSDELLSRSVVVANGSFPEHILDGHGTISHRTMRAMSFKMDIRDDTREIRFHVKGSLEGGYGWFFPRGDHANAGIVTYGNPRDELEWLLKKENVPKERIIGFSGGIIPVSGPVDPLVGEGCILAGDSMGAANPVSKGGVVGALMTGREGGEALSGYLDGDIVSLEAWRNTLFEHPSLSLLNLERTRVLSSLDDDVLNSLGEIFDGREVWSVRKTDVLKEILKRPPVLRSLRGALKLARGGREWARWAF